MINVNDFDEVSPRHRYGAMVKKFKENWNLKKEWKFELQSKCDMTIEVNKIVI